MCSEKEGIRIQGGGWASLFALALGISGAGHRVVIAAAKVPKPIGEKFAVASGSGLRPVTLAIDSIRGLPMGTKRRLAEDAAAAIRRYGPMPPSKQRVAFSQTRRYLNTLLEEVRGGGPAGLKLLRKMFGWNFANFMRLPALTRRELADAHSIGKRAAAAIGPFVGATFVDTPPALRKRLAAAAQHQLGEQLRTFCDYYQVGTLYPSHHLPSVAGLVKDFMAMPLASAGHTAFASVRELIREKSVPQRNRLMLERQFISVQAASVAGEAMALLGQKYFSARLPAAASAFRNCPQGLQRRWIAFGNLQAARAQKRWQEATDPNFDSALYPTAAQFLKGSGIKRP